jgi:glycosyltransferase involved in cell wall biosynthesis
MQYRIAQLTSVHPRYDTRIFIKECCSLAKNENYDVSLIVSDGLGYEERNMVKIYDVGKKKGRLSRMLKTTRLIFQKAIELEADVYHFHDPELIPIGLKLKKIGKTVIFDVHEDVPKQLRSKPYLNPFILRGISFLFAWYERIVCKNFDYIITATPSIRDKFLKINKNAIDINNFPVLGELENNFDLKSKNNEVCYVGTIYAFRGIRELVKALEYTEGVTLNLAGKFVEDNLKQEITQYRGWKQVNELGYLNRREVANVLNRSKAGLVILHPISNYLDSLPVKMFEYMSVGLPVIASNFPLWKKIVEGNNCGICVDPFSPKEIAEAIKYIINNPKEAEKMGKNGKKIVKEKYNWSKEEQKLFKIYSEIITN